MAIEVQELPKTDAYVDVAILDGGGMIGSSSLMHAEGPPTDINMSCWVFYINHPTTGKKVIWDVGISAVHILAQNGIDEYRIQKIMAMRHRKFFITPRRGLVQRRIYLLNWRNGAGSRGVRLMPCSSVTLTGGILRYSQLMGQGPLPTDFENVSQCSGVFRPRNS